MIGGIIDIGSCAQIAAKSVTDNIVPLGIVVGMFGMAFIVAALYASIEGREKKSLEDFLRKEGLLNKYANWKKDR